MTLPKIVYHITERENLYSIFDKGEGLNRTAHRKRIGIYCCENPKNWIGLCKNPVVIQVDTNGITADVSYFPESDEFIIWGDIPLANLHIINFNEGEN